jgi:acyl carrier protein
VAEADENYYDIGKPIANTGIHLLDACRQPVPIGYDGEIYVSGSGVTQGYLNNSRLTAEKYPETESQPGTHWYRTGDVARWTADGNLVLKGRIDRQVKVKGYRIELEEIELVLNRHESISNTVVVTLEEEDGNENLVAYYLSEAELRQGELHEYLTHRLADYMIPAYFVRVQAFPYTPAGKLNLKALPDPRQISAAGNTGSRTPKNDTERQLLDICKEVLGRELLYITDNFFHVGGHSLRATMLSFRIEREMGIKLRLSWIFQNPTLESIAEEIENLLWTTQDVATGSQSSQIMV